MINVNQITSQLAKMPDPMLQKFAAMHKDDPYTVSLALAESNRRKELRSGVQAQLSGQQMPKVVDEEINGIAPRQLPQQMPHQLPEDVGIGALPAQNIQKMAGGGIVAFDEGGEVPRFQNKGAVEEKEGPAQYRAYALKKAEEMGLDPIWVDRIFSHESKTEKSPMGYDPNAVSPTGATGIGQLVKHTANHYMRKTGHLGLQDKFDPEIRKDPYKNIDASMALMADLKQKYKGDPRLMAVAYNQGEPYLDKHLKENNGKLNPDALKAEPKTYLQKTVDAIVPSAQAAQTAPAAPAASAAPAAPAADNRPWYDRGRELMQSGQAQLAMLQGVGDVAPALAGAPVDLSYYIANKLGRTPVAGEKPVMGSKWIQEKLRSVGLNAPEPTNPDLQTIREATTGIAGLYNPFGKAETVETAAQAVARRQAEKAAAAEAKVANPRLAGPTTDTTMVQGAGYPPVVNGRSVAAQVADKEAAAAEALRAEQAAKVAAESGGARQFTNTINPLGVAAAAPEATEGVASLLSNKPTTPAAADTAAAPTPEGGIENLVKPGKNKEGAEPSKFKDEMALQFFLGLMGGQSPNALTNVSQAGLGALKYGQEAKKEEAEQMYKKALAEHYGVPSEVQMLEYLKDPENMAAYMQQRKAIGEPALMKELVADYLKNPAGMAVLEKSNPALFAAIKQQAMSAVTPQAIAGLPGAGATTRAPV